MGAEADSTLCRRHLLIIFPSRRRSLSKSDKLPYHVRYGKAALVYGYDKVAWLVFRKLSCMTVVSSHPSRRLRLSVLVAAALHLGCLHFLSQRQSSSRLCASSVEDPVPPALLSGRRLENVGLAFPSIRCSLLPAPACLILPNAERSAVSHCKRLRHLVNCCSSDRGSVRYAGDN
jgi:hypothetical protein